MCIRDSLSLVQDVIRRVHHNEYKRQQAAPNLKVTPQGLWTGPGLPDCAQVPLREPLMEYRRLDRNEPELKKSDLIAIGCRGFHRRQPREVLSCKGFSRIRAADKKPFSDWYLRLPEAENLCLDCSNEEARKRVCDGATEVYNLAADIGGMEFINLGSSELVTIDVLVTLVESISGVKLRRKYDFDAPRGVAGRNSDNTFIKQVLKWEPDTTLKSGLRETCDWIRDQYSRCKHGQLTVS